MNNSLYRFLFGFYLVILAVFTFYMIRYWNASMTHAGLSSGRAMHVSAMVLIVFSVFVLFAMGFVRAKGIHLTCLLWCMVMIFVHIYNQERTASNYVLTLLWPILFETAFSFCKKNPHWMVSMRKFFVIIALYGAYLFLVAQSRIEGQTNVIYFSLLTLPWLLSHKSPKNQFVILVLFSVLIVLSLKRSSLLVMLLYWGFYGLTMLKKRSYRILTIVAIIAIVIIGPFAYDRIDDALGGRLNERVTREETNEGRNRLAIYEVTWAMIQQSSVDHLVFGHGHMGVYNDSPLQISAHNDFLEVVYDYGLLVFFLYLCLWLYVVKKCIKLYKEGSLYFYPYAVSLSIFLIMSLVSHLILYASYFNFIVLFWGGIEGLTYNENKELQ